jgi:hypothetical protein
MATTQDASILFLDNFNQFKAAFCLALIQKGDAGACLSNHLQEIKYQLPPSQISLKTFLAAN